MGRLEPLSPDANPELKENFEHFSKRLGYIPNNVLVLSRKPKLVKGLARLASAVVAINGFLNRWNDTVAPPLEVEPTAFAKEHLSRYF